MLQENLTFNNRNLFSNLYLLSFIQSTTEWKKKDHVEAFNAIKRVYTAQSAFFDGLKEAQLEERFFTIIFKKILPFYEVQESAGTDSPDYAFFDAQNSIDTAHRSENEKSFFNGALAVGEVKRWDVEMDRFGKDRHIKRRNPSFQMWLYLNETGVNWGILSNGRKWRLYRKDKPLDVYYEVDLANLLENNDLEGFKYYYYFFRREAFLPNEAGEIFLAKVLKGSDDYRHDIGDNLKENVYRAMKKIAEGFFSWPENRLDYNKPGTRETVQKNTMILLYRLLFLLYAEGKGLLDLRNESYRDAHSFDRIKKEVAAKRDGPSQHHYLPTSTSLWGSLRNLFRLIDKGSQELKIDRIIHIPAYNGGLFEPEEENRQLDKWTIGDSFLADAIDLLSRSGIGEGGMGFVDYSTLEIRHLGSIYEGLLEYKLMVAESDFVVTGSEKERRWITLEDYNKEKSKKKAFDEFDEFDRARKGELYLSTDRGDRKATGSYYTPDYIVNYIVANTVGPVVEERWKIAEEDKSSNVDATLSVKVLDPAMGSGHFLVGAVEFLAVKLMAAAQRDIETGLVEDDGQFTNDWAKREAVSHCVYGVDLNDMAVELAKVSLWLTTISKEKPLSFLDHRLKKGNSLIGARISDLKNYPGGNRKDENQASLPSFVSPLFIKNLIGKIKELEGVGEDTLSDIKRKEKIFEEFKTLPQYTKAKAIANVHTSIYFGNQIDPSRNKDPEMVYHDMFWGVAGDEAEWRRKTWGQWFKQAQETAAERSFFHWELEFPEIFFESGRRKDNAGFDVVIGNPPWGAYLTCDDGRYLSGESGYKVACNGSVDTYSMFIECGLRLLKKETWMSYITPDTFLRKDDHLTTRALLLKDTCILELLELGPVFEKARDTWCSIFIVKTSPPNESTSIKHKKISRFVVSVEKRLEKFAQKEWDIETEMLQSVWLQNRGMIIGYLASMDEQQLISKIGNSPTLGQLSDLYIISRGEEGSKSKLKETNDGDFRKVIPENIDKYEISEGKRIPGSCLTPNKIRTFYRHPKIWLIRIQKMRWKQRIVSAFDIRTNSAGMKTLQIIVSPADKTSDLKYLQAILASRLDFSNHPDIAQYDRFVSLVDQMQEAHNSKQKEIEGFIAWLEDEIGAKIKDLDNTSKLQKYNDLEFTEFHKLLLKNKRKLKEGYNPSAREPKKLLAMEFQSSVSKLNSLIENINVIDGLIDNLVYKLYKLTEEEIGLLKGTRIDHRNLLHPRGGNSHGSDLPRLQLFSTKI